MGVLYSSNPLGVVGAVVVPSYVQDLDRAFMDGAAQTCQHGSSSSSLSAMAGGTAASRIYNILMSTTYLHFDLEPGSLFSADIS